MKEIRYKVTVAPGYNADAVVGKDVFEIKQNLREIGRFRGTLWELAQVAAANPDRRMVLVLVTPELSRPTIEAGWESLLQVLRPDLAHRLAIWIFRETDVEGYPAGPDDQETELVREILQAPQFAERSRGPTHGDSLSEVLRLLLCRWLLEEGPVTLTGIGEVLGYTFKPVRAALDTLERYLEPHGKRGVTLKAFPREPWARLVHNARAIRGTLHFAHHGRDKGRSAESLLNRFHSLGLPDIAVGGVEGTRHYNADLDLLGLPRLDLCIHQRGTKPDLAFLRALDPGLRPVANDEPSPLAIHFLYRRTSLFDQGWADPVECLLDLHEMRLEGQALQFLRSFPAAQKETP